jgi:maltooligosyltrehalose synthase
VIAFARRLETDAVIAVAPRFVARLHLPGPPVGAVWTGTWLALPDGWAFRACRNVLTGETVDVVTREGRPALAVESALGAFPVALLEATDEP